MLVRCTLLGLFLLSITGCSSTKDASENKAQAPLPQSIISINERKLLVEIAHTDAERRAGLAHRKHLKPDSGMLFVYQNSKTRYFTTAETTLSLSIAFIDKNGSIVDIQQLQPLNERSYRSKSVARYVLEVNRGWFKKNNIQIGHKGVFPERFLIKD